MAAAELSISTSSDPIVSEGRLRIANATHLS